jgi:flavin-dependent dehydrogenase
LSGKIAGEVAGESIKRGEIRYLKEYEKRWFSLEGRNMRFRMKVRDVFMKLKDEDLEILFDFGERNFGNKTINEINEMKIIRGIIKFSPKLFKLGVHLLR